MAFDKNEVLQLISLKQEGSYWDFKGECYPKGKEKRADLVHDILAMANNLENRDAYIIIGIDEENNFAPFDLLKGKNRKKLKISFAC